MKKFIASLLTATMLFSLGTPVFAIANDMEHEHNQDGWTCTENVEQGELTCEIEEHEHSEECNAEAPDPNLTCEIEDEEHEHSEDCFAEAQVQPCELEEHVHTEACYAQISSWVCEEPVVEKKAEQVNQTVMENHFINRGAFKALVLQTWLEKTNGKDVPENAHVHSTDLQIQTMAKDSQTSKETQINSGGSITWFNQDTLGNNGKYIQPEDIEKFQVNFTYSYFKKGLLKIEYGQVDLLPTQFNFMVFEESNLAEWHIKDQSQATEKVEVMFDFNDGSELSEQNKIFDVEIGSTLAQTDIPNFSREGYDFTGWFADKAAAQAFDVSNQINEDTVIYAGWKQAEYIPSVPSHESMASFYINLNGTILNVDSLVSNTNTTPSSRFTGNLTPGNMKILVDFAQWAKDYPSVYSSKDAGNYINNFENQKSAGLVGTKSDSADEIDAILREFFKTNLRQYIIFGDNDIMKNIKKEIVDKNKTIQTINKNVVSVDLINEDYYTPQWYVVKLVDGRIWHVDGVLKETPKFENTFSVQYKWEGKAPTTAVLPNDGKSVKYAENAKITIEQPAATTIVADGGTYTFQGWKINGAPAANFNINADTVITGSWTFEADPEIPEEKYFGATYEWEGKAPTSAVLPLAANYKEGTLVTIAQLEQTTIKADGGTYNFQGWKINGAPAANFNITADTVITGSWTFEADPEIPEEKYFGATYEWEGKAPTSAVLPLAANYKEGTLVTIAQLEQTTIKADGGTYTFQGWKINGAPAANFNIAEDTVIIGSWSFTPNGGTEDREPDKDPEIEIEDPDVPLTEDPDGEKEEDVKEEEEEIIDNEIPLVTPPELPGVEEEMLPEEIIIEEKKVPLANLPKTGGAQGGLIAIVGMIAVGSGLMMNRKKED